MWADVAWRANDATRISSPLKESIPQRAPEVEKTVEAGGINELLAKDDVIADVLVNQSFPEEMDHEATKKMLSKYEKVLDRRL